jgi:hypothetical protein
VANQEHGIQNGYPRAWMLPAKDWEQGLWPGVRASLSDYVKEHRIQPHGGAHNSSRSSYGDPNDPVFVEPFREAHNFK